MPSTINRTESEEKEYLEIIKDKLNDAITQADAHVNAQAKDVQEFKDYLWENKTGMDHVEKIAVRQSITQAALTGENTLAKKRRLSKLLSTPYFGRIDFTQKGSKAPSPIYIGIHSFLDTKKNENLIHDWRAPISSMFYDFELGNAYYQAPSGETHGNILLKRQYRIRDGRMEFMLESALSIHDDILQKELSQTSEEKMKNIVATIQRDQNQIIRNEISQVLIIQGVAGSGKTSIALHRIAFLLYRFKDQISSDEILIISPNKVFADYISNVLPELGEEKIGEIGMDDLAHQLMDKKYKFQNFFEQVSILTEKKDDGFVERIRFKSSPEMIIRLNEFLVHIENEYFKPTDLVIRRFPIPAWFIEERYKSYHRLPLLKRFQEIVRDIDNNIQIYYNYQVTTSERNEVSKAVQGMFRTTNIRNLYKEFYEWLGKPELLKLAKGSVFEYADVFPLIYLKIQLEGVKPRREVKHLIVDEMQDYSPIQYWVLSKLFPCNKTILGDSNQAVNPHSASTAEGIARIFPQADTMMLSKSYRSTYQIAQFAQRIKPNPNLIAIERNGDEPAIKEIKTSEAETEEIMRLLTHFQGSSFKSLGIICKTSKQASKLYEQLSEILPNIHLLNVESAAFINGIIITTVHLSKGLEFDSVIVPFCNVKNYSSDFDRHLLYIACTRAMHRLDITCVGGRSGLLPN